MKHTTPPQKKRRGRPAKPPGEKREHSKTTYLSTKEQELFDRNRGEYSESDYLRLVAVYGTQPTPPVPTANKAEYLRLHELQEQMDQLRAVLPEPAEEALSNPTDIARALWRLLKETQTELVRLRRALIGESA